MELEENISPTVALDSSNKTKHDIQKDVTDIPPRSCKISNFDIIMMIISLIVHFIDVGIDINLVIQYYMHNKLRTFAWTIALILIPSFINTVVSLQMYQQDDRKNCKSDQNPKNKWVIKKIGKFIIFILVVAFQFTMAQRSFYSLIYALKSRDCKKKNNTIGQKKYFIKMLREEEDIALLRVLECFIEAAPQQILQLSIFIQEYYGEFSLMSLHQIISIASSFVSLAWAMTSYHRNIRLAQENKKNIHFLGSALQFLWHLFITTSRIACVSAAAIFSMLCVIIACFIHWFIMTVWIITESRGLNAFCLDSNRAPHLPRSIIETIKSTLFSCVFGFIYIFIYLNPEETHTYTKHFFYYTICFLENIAASIVVVVGLPNEVNIVWHHYVVSACCIVPFILGIIIMTIYYTKFHPSMKHHTLSFSKILRIK